MTGAVAGAPSRRCGRGRPLTDWLAFCSPSRGRATTVDLLPTPADSAPGRVQSGAFPLDVHSRSRSSTVAEAAASTGAGHRGEPVPTMGPRRGERRHALKLPEERGAPRAASSRVLPATPASMKEVMEAEEQPKTGCAAAPAAVAGAPALLEDEAGGDTELDAKEDAGLKSARLPQPTEDNRAERGACWRGVSGKIRARSGQIRAIRDQRDMQRR